MKAGERKAANVLAFPALNTVPPPDLPLKGVAYDKYMELARGLLNSRKLNTFTRSKCEDVAILHQTIHKRVELGLQVSKTMIDARGRLMRELQLVDESESTAVAPIGKENRYSGIGVIVRAGTQKAAL